MGQVMHGENRCFGAIALYPPLSVLLYMFHVVLVLLFLHLNFCFLSSSPLQQKKVSVEKGHLLSSLLQLIPMSTNLVLGLLVALE